MTRAEYIVNFVQKYGPLLAVNLRGEHTYLIPVDYMAKHGVKKALQDAEKGMFDEVTGTPKAECHVPDLEVVSLIAVIQRSPAADVGVHKLPDDPMGLTRVSIGGDTREAVYVTYRGTIENAIKFTELGLHFLQQQAKKGEASPPHSPENN